MQVILSVGARWHSYHQARELAKRGYLKLFITGHRGNRQDIGISQSLIRSIPFPDYLGYMAKKLPLFGGSALASDIKDPLFDRMASRLLCSCDIFHSYNNFALYSMRRAAQFGSIRIVESGAHPEAYQELYMTEYELLGFKHPRPVFSKRFIEKSTQEFAEADYVFLSSQFAYNTFSTRGFDMNKVRVLPLGYDPTLFGPSNQPLSNSSEFIILFVGRINIFKGIYYLLEAVKQLSLPNTRLILVGPLEESGRVVLSRYTGLFEWKDKVPQQELKKIYNMASLFVLPSIAEGSAMVVYEAMSCGLPVIVSANTGSIVRHGVDGYITPIRNIEKLKEYIEYLYRNPEERRRLGQAASVYVRNYTWKHYGERLVREYEALLSTH